MILVTLRYYATGSFQKLDGDVMNICQQSVSRIITTVSNSIALQMKMFVKFPSTVEDINQVKQKFFEVAQFPGVIGCIDYGNGDQKGNCCGSDMCMCHTAQYINNVRRCHDAFY
ncbi:unnamed protein product [Parnassius apollo]|uniref:(apollo) hypothetical protein n=1 Tax=Parnassius apollo TaxID=110799 RepID=A0A8S3X4U2_PARAO|nr:unnamed protein product [Parnassius apollo]